MVRPGEPQSAAIQLRFDAFAQRVMDLSNSLAGFDDYATTLHEASLGVEGAARRHAGGGPV